MSKTTSQPPIYTKAEIDAAAAELRQFWDYGHKSLTAHRACKPRSKQFMKVTKAEAKQVRWNPDKVRRAHLFASAKRCATKEELEKRIAEARSHGYPPRWLVLGTVYQVTDTKQRQAIWRQCLREKLSSNQVEICMRVQNLDRDTHCAIGGRPPQAPQSAAEARYRLHVAATHLLRLERACRNALHDDGLPTKARRTLAQAVRVLTDLKADMPIERGHPD